MAFQRPGAGALRTRVELQNKGSVASGSDALTDSYTVVDTVSARVREIFGGRIVENVNTVQRATHNVVIRYRSDAGSWDFLEYGPAGQRRRLRVISVMAADERGRWLEILAEEERRGV